MLSLVETIESITLELVWLCMLRNLLEHCSYTLHFLCTVNFKYIHIRYIKLLIHICTNSVFSWSHCLLSCYNIQTKATWEKGFIWLRIPCDSPSLKKSHSSKSFMELLTLHIQSWRNGRKQWINPCMLVLKFPLYRSLCQGMVKSKIIMGLHSWINVISGHA